MLIFLLNYLLVLAPNLNSAHTVNDLVMSTFGIKSAVTTVSKYPNLLY